MFALSLDHSNQSVVVSASSTDAIKSELAARIVGLLDRKQLSVRSAGVIAATAAADLSSIRQGKLDRFTVDRLIAILTRLDHSLEISVQVSHRRKITSPKNEGET